MVEHFPAEAWVQYSVPCHKTASTTAPLLLPNLNTPHQASGDRAQPDLEPEVPENEHLALDTGCLFPTPAGPTSNFGWMTVVRRELQCKGKGQ